MATSGSVNYNVTTSDLLSSAFELARVKDPGENLTTQQTTQGLGVINKIVKYMQKIGMPLWAIKKDTITLVQSTQSYTCGTGGTGLTERPLRILQAFYRDGSSDTPVEIVSRQSYWELGDKSAEGIPTQIYYDPQLTLGTLYVYNPADANSAGNALHLIYHRPFEDLDTITDDFDFPQEWYLPLEYTLAADIATRNGITQGRINFLTAKATVFINEVKWWDTEDVSVRIQPNEN